MKNRPHLSMRAAEFYMCGCDLCLLCIHASADDEESCDYKNCTNHESDDCVLNEACNDVADEADCCNGESIGQLSGNVPDVVDVSTGRCHDGGVRYGRDMVAADSTCKAGGNADHEEALVVCENRENDGDQDTESAPGGAGCKCKTESNKEDNCGQHREETLRCAFDKTCDIFGSAEHGGHVFEGKSEGEDEQCGNHCVEALDDAGSSFLEGDNAAAEKINEGNDECNNAAPGETDGSISVSEGVDKGSAIPEAADIHHTNDAADNEDDNGNEHIPDACAGNFLLFLVAERTEVAHFSFELSLCHRTVIEAHDGESDNENDGQERVEVIGDSLNEELNTGNTGVEILCGGGNCCCPGGDGSDHADRSCGCVDNESELCAGDLLTVSDRAHDGADGEAVEIVINENHNAEEEGCKQSTYAGMNMLCSPLAECRGAAGEVNESNHDSEQNKEHENTGIPTVSNSTDKAIVDHGVQSADRVETCHEEGTDKNTDEEGGISFLCDKGKNYSHNRRDQCPKSTVHDDVPPK